MSRSTRRRFIQQSATLGIRLGPPATEWARSPDVPSKNLTILGESRMVATQWKETR